MSMIYNIMKKKSYQINFLYVNCFNLRLYPLVSFLLTLHWRTEINKFVPIRVALLDRLNVFHFSI